MVAALRFLDEDGEDVELDVSEAAALMALTNELDSATVSACAQCRSRVLATVALVDLLDAAQPHPRSGDLISLADEAPTLHLYVLDLADRVPAQPVARPGLRGVARRDRRRRARRPLVDERGVRL